MKTLKQKLSSRKFLTSVVGVIMGIAMVFGLDGDAISTIAGAVVSLVSVITYVYTEGKVNTAALEDAAEAILYEMEADVEIED